MGNVVVKKALALLVLTALVACDEPEFYTTPIEGPRTKDPVVFAKGFLDQLQARSFAANREFCGVFGRDAQGYIIATPPIQGMLDSCLTPLVEADFRVFASYHSHGAYDAPADSEVPSSNDLRADRAENVIGFISTPGGRVWRSEDGRAHQICGIGCITTDPDFVPGVFGPVASRYTIAQLRAREGS